MGHFGVQCIFTSTNFHSKLEEINLLAICSDSADTAHFVLIQKFNLFMQYIFKQKKGKSKQTIYFCQFCLQKKSKIKKVINEHELFCLAYSGILWHTLAYSGKLWHTLTYSGIHWHTLAYPGILWHTRAYSGKTL